MLNTNQHKIGMSVYEFVGNCAVMCFAEEKINEFFCA
jgi:hypothetical protein